MSEHAHISPSGAHRHLRCLASLQAEALVPNHGSSYADEGTRAHTAASHVLNGDLEAVVYDDDDMARYVGQYVELVRKYAEGGHLLVEQRVDFSKFMFDGEPPMLDILVDETTGEIVTVQASAFGTSDAVILKPAIRQLIMIDLKYGMGVKVDAPDNEQLMLYALGCLHEYDWMGPFDEIVMVIHMPRLKHISEHTISVVDLLAFAAEAKAKYAVALGPNPDFTPGDKQCKFCSKAKAPGGCEAARREATAPVGQDADLSAFDVVEGDAKTQAAVTLAQIRSNLQLVTDDDLGKRMRMVELAEIWCKGVRAECETRMLIHGVKVPGQKIVMGRQGPRKWTNEGEVEAQMKKWKLKTDEMYDKTLISPTTAEKVLEGSPKRWKDLQDLITRSDGKPSVAPDEDTRPAIAGNVDLDAFEMVTDQSAYV